MSNSILCTLILFLLGISSASFGQKPCSNPEQMPVFPECATITDKVAMKSCSDQKLMSFVAKNVKYPKQALDENTTGTTVIKFIITKKGTIKDAQIVRDLGNGCGKEALRVVNEMNKQGIVWIPGQEAGKKVDVLYHLPISFKLPK